MNLFDEKNAPIILSNGNGFSNQCKIISKLDSTFQVPFKTIKLLKWSGMFRKRFRNETETLLSNT